MNRNFFRYWGLALALALIARPGSACDRCQAREQEDVLSRSYQPAAAQANAQVAAQRLLLAAAFAPEAASVKVVIFHTNDIHGYIGPYAGNPSRNLPPSGGAASLATLLKGEALPHLWIDSGDWYQGALEGTLTKGDAVVDIFNRLGLTASELGNHDFDFGQANVQRLAGLAHFSILGANISDAGQVPAYAKPFVLSEVYPGVRVGIFGLITQNMPKLLSRQNIAGLSFAREIDAARAAVLELRRQGATIIIAATHIGIENVGGLDTGVSEGDIFLANNVPGIDLILGGHTHSELQQPVIVSTNGVRTMITQTRGNLSAVYRIELTVDPQTGALAGADGKLVPLDPAQYPPDPDIQQIVAAASALVTRAVGHKIGETTVDLNRGHVESNLGNWIADTLRLQGNADIGVINTKGIRADLPKGDLTSGDIYKVFPFDNSIYKVEITGAELKRLIEQNFGDGTVSLQYSGLNIVFNPAAPPGQRLTALTVGGVPVDDAKTYTISTLDFIVNVDKTFVGIKTRLVDMSATGFRDLLIETVRKTSPISPALDGRVKAAP